LNIPEFRIFGSHIFMFSSCMVSFWVRLNKHTRYPCTGTRNVSGIQCWIEKCVSVQMVMELTKMETWEVYVNGQWWWSSEIWDPAVLVDEESESWWQEKFALKDWSLSKMVNWACMQWSVAIGICWQEWWLLHLNTGLVLVSSAMSVICEVSACDLLIQATTRLVRG
jgi:hypothetical protein